MFSLTGWLLLGLLLLPTVGALLARLVARWAGARAVQLTGVLGFAAAIGCLIALRWMPQDAATLGRLRIFLPSSDVVVARESLLELPTAAPAALAIAPTSAPTTRPTARATRTPTPTRTALPTATEAPPPTEVPPTEIPPTEAPAPTEAPPPEPTAPPRQTAQRYVVEAGDTLRSIAERFDVSVEALLRYNGLSPEEGDSLQVGQELLIPPQ